jgi:hypothetical protein
MSAGITAGARGAAAGLGQASAGNACRVPGNVSQATWPEVEKPRPRNHGQSRGGAPRGERARSERSSVARAAPEARAGGDICSCGAADFVCAFRRSASLFYLEAKHSRLSFLLQNSGANGAAKTCLLYPPLEGEGRGPKGRGVGCAAAQGLAARCARFHPNPPRFAWRPSPSRRR